MKKVSIIIPFKGQDEGKLAVPLGSINSQFGIDFSQVDVHLINDGGPVIDMNRLSVFTNLDLHYHQLTENVGPGMARQYGIDHSKSDYIMFMDSDDVLRFGGALLDFFNVIKTKGEHQIINGRYIEQFLDSKGGFRYVAHPFDWKAVYAKWFRRSYIEEKGLRFHPDLRIFEDTYFVVLSCKLATDIYRLDSMVYAWLNNPDSITRKLNKAFRQQTHTLALENRLYLETIRKQKPELLKPDLNNYVCDIYMRIQLYHSVDPEAFWVEHTKLLREFSKYWDGYTDNLQKQVDAKRDDPKGRWHNVSTDGFKEFVEKVKV